MSAFTPTEDWVWDKHTKVMSSRQVITIENFSPVISFVCAKQLLEPMRLVTRLQDNFEFKKIEEIIHTYNEIREKANELFQSV